MALPELSQFLVLLINLLGAFLGFTVYRRDPKGAVNRIFLLTIVLMLVWVNLAYIPRLLIRTNADVALVLMRIAWTATPLFAASLYFLTVYLTHSQSRFRFLHWVVGALGLAAISLTAFTGLVVEGIRLVGDAVVIDYGPGMWPFLGIISAYMAATSFAFYRGYSTLPAQNRLQLQYVGIGLLIFYAANVIFNVAFPVFFGVVRWYWLGDYSTLAVLGFTGYAIIRKHLFGIRVILTALLVALIAMVLAVDVVILTEASLPRIVKGLVFLIFLYFGYMLVQGVHLEIERREKLREVAEELRRADETKTEFISIVSHQLRTPLNAIKGYLSLLLEGTYGELDRKKRTLMERVHQSNERLIRLVDDLLNVSRIQMGRIELEMGEVDLCEVTQGVVDDFTMIAEEKGIELHAVCPERGLPPVTGDTRKLRDSIMNLVENAIDYTDKGGVDVSVVAEDGDVVVRVTDTGPGLDKTEAAALFESFERGDVGRKPSSEGTGLGLYIAHQFVALHGGKIWAESPGKGRGSTFFIRLPFRGREMAA